MKKVLAKHIQGKKVLLLFILTKIVYGVMLLITIPKVMAYSSSLKLLDMMPTGYTAEYVKSLFNTLGPEGRDAYLYTQIPVDMIYPLLFGIAYCLVLAFFLNKLDKLKAPFTYLCFLPVLAGLADYFENFGIIALLSNYPDISNSVVSLTNVFSLVKSATTTLFFLALLISLFALGARILRKKGGSN